MVNYKEVYAVVHPASIEDFNKGKDTLSFFDTKEEMEQLLISLSQQLTMTNQPLTEFTRVFPKGAVLNGESYERFSAERKANSLPSYDVGNGYFVQFTLKKGKNKLKYYNMAEDFDWQLDDWSKKGRTDVVILNSDKSLSGKYYHQHDIQHYWGNKESLFA